MSETYLSPFYLFKSSHPCWSCKKQQPVVGLASGDDEPFMLHDIEAMPEAFLTEIRKIHPRYELRLWRRYNSTFYSNYCICGAPFADFYMFSEPDGAFFPMDEDAAKYIEIYKLPFEGEFEFTCSDGIGTGGRILKYGKRNAAEQGAAANP